MVASRCVSPTSATHGARGVAAADFLFASDASRALLKRASVPLASDVTCGYLHAAPQRGPIPRQRPRACDTLARSCDLRCLPGMHLPLSLSSRHPFGLLCTRGASAACLLRSVVRGCLLVH